MTADAKITKAIEALRPGELFYVLAHPSDYPRRAVEVVPYPNGVPRPFVLVRFAYTNLDLAELFGDRNMSFYEWGEMVEVVGAVAG